MKRTFLVLIASLIAVFNVFAQENTLLWKISGKGLKQDAYLLGTLHILCPDDFSISEKVAKAITEVEQVIFEVNIADPNTAKLMQQAAMTPNIDFFKDYDPAKLKTIDSVLTMNQMSIKIFDMLNPSTVTSLLALKSFNCPNPMEVKSMENEIYTLAKDKSIGELETIEFQMSMLNQISTPDYFYNYLVNYEEGAALTSLLVNAYKAEDLEALAAIMMDTKYMPQEHIEIMLTQRNKNWVASLPSKIKNSKSLIAVGAGHLIGEEGLIKLLQKDGYTLTPIY